MKIILQITLAVVLTCTIVQSKAQIVPGSLSADWTFTDINGVSQNLYTYLNAGKTVFIDISWTWCTPCWDYHIAGALDSIWTYHGPVGAPGVSSSTTNDCMVFFVENDETTTSADLHGTGPNTDGDWVTGTDYPIIDLPTYASVVSFNSMYPMPGAPSCLMICPNRLMTNVSDYFATELYAAKSACSAATVAVDAEMITSIVYNTALASCDSVTPTFRLGNIGTSPLTFATITFAVDGITQKIINWTGNLTTYESTTVTGVKIGATVAGTHTITATISNPNGVSDPTSSNNSTSVSFVVYPTVGGPYIVETFENSGIPSDWLIINGGSYYTWDYTYNTGFNSSVSAVLSFLQIPSGQIEIMKLPPMSFSSSTTVSLTFDVAYAQYSASNNDRLQVDVSIDCGTTWTTEYDKAGETLKTVPPLLNSFFPTNTSEWRHESINLNIYAGQPQVFVRFKGTSDYGNNLYVDNVNFSSFGVGIQENEMLNTISVYPNPITNNAFVEFNLAETNAVTIEMVNTIGQVVLHENIGKLNAGIQNYSLNAASLSNGLYFLNIKIGDNTVTQKVAIYK